MRHTLYSLLLLTLLSISATAQKRQLNYIQVADNPGEYYGSIFGKDCLLDVIIENIDSLPIYDIDYSSGEISLTSISKVRENSVNSLELYNWDPDVIYEYDDFVSFEDKIYMSTSPSNDFSPAEGITWIEYDPNDLYPQINRIVIDASTGKKRKVYFIGVEISPAFNNNTVTFYIPFNDLAKKINEKSVIIEQFGDVPSWIPSLLKYSIRDPKFYLFTPEMNELIEDKNGSRISIKIDDQGDLKSLDFYDQSKKEQSQWASFYSITVSELNVLPSDPILLTTADFLQTDWIDEDVSTEFTFPKYRVKSIKEQKDWDTFYFDIEEEINYSFQENRFLGQNSSGFNARLVNGIKEGEILAYDHEKVLMSASDFKLSLIIQEAYAEYWDPFVSYYEGDFVEFEGSFYTSINDGNSNYSPGDLENQGFMWQEISNFNEEYYDENFRFNTIESKWYFNKDFKIKNITPEWIGIGIPEDVSLNAFNEILWYLKWEDVVGYFEVNEGIGYDSLNSVFTNYVDYLANRQFKGLVNNIDQIRYMKDSDIIPNIELPSNEIISVSSRYTETVQFNTESTSILLPIKAYYDTLVKSIQAGQISTFDLDSNFELFEYPKEEFINLLYDKVIFLSEENPWEIEVPDDIYSEVMLTGIFMLRDRVTDQNGETSSDTLVGIGIILSNGMYESTYPSAIFKAKELEGIIPDSIINQLHNSKYEPSQSEESGIFKKAN